MGLKRISSEQTSSDTIVVKKPFTCLLRCDSNAVDGCETSLAHPLVSYSLIPSSSSERSWFPSRTAACIILLPAHRSYSIVSLTLGTCHLFCQFWPSRTTSQTPGSLRNRHKRHSKSFSTSIRCSLSLTIIFLRVPLSYSLGASCKYPHNTILQL